MVGVGSSFSFLSFLVNCLAHAHVVLILSSIKEVFWHLFAVVGLSVVCFEFSFRILVGFLLFSFFPWLFP